MEHYQFNRYLRLRWLIMVKDNKHDEKDPSIRGGSRAHEMKEKQRLYQLSGGSPARYKKLLEAEQRANEEELEALKKEVAEKAAEAAKAEKKKKPAKKSKGKVKKNADK